MLAGCSGPKSRPAETADASAVQASNPADSSRAVLAPALESSLREFEKAVIQRDTAKLLELLDPDYRRKELGGFFKGNTVQFFNEFFCGKTIKGDQLHCLVLNEISFLMRAEVAGLGRATEVVYHVTSPTAEIEARLRVTLGKDGEVIGFIGSNGYTQVE